MAKAKRFTFDKERAKKVAKNALIFLAPALLVLLADITKALPEWIQGPYLVIGLWVVNTATDALRKFVNR